MLKHPIAFIHALYTCVSTIWLVLFVFSGHTDVAARFYVDVFGWVLLHLTFVSYYLGFTWVFRYGVPLSFILSFAGLTFTEGIGKLWQCQPSVLILFMWITNDREQGGAMSSMLTGLAFLVISSYQLLAQWVRAGPGGIPLDEMHPLFAVSCGIVLTMVILHYAQRETRRARHQLQEAMAVKEVFLAHVSHELRTPLAGVIGYCELLSRSTATKDKESIEGIKTCADSALLLINDILSWSSIKSGAPQIEAKVFSIGTLTAKIDHACSQLLRGKLEWKLECHVDPECMFHGDSRRILQVVSGLVSNSVKFTEPGGHVTVCISSRQRSDKGHPELLIEVIDTGIGFSPSDGASIFEAFVKGGGGSNTSNVSNTTTQSSRVDGGGGVGLGLAISKELVELMGGTISAHSAGVGSGSTFVIALPCGAHAGNNHRAEETTIITSADSSNSPRYGRTATDDPDAKAKLSLLLVEDNPMLLRVLSLQIEHLLADYDLDIVCASDGMQALPHLSSRRFDVIITDICMPNVDGIELTILQRRREKQRAKQGNVKRAVIVGISALTDVADENLALERGMDAYLKKPVKLGQLQSTLRSLL